MTSEIIPIMRSKGQSGVGARNHCVHGKNQIVVEDVLDMHQYDYFTVAHTPQGRPATLFMTFHFQEIPENKTRFTLTFKARSSFRPGWLNKHFCKLILRIQLFKSWKMESINELINNDSAFE